MVNVLTYMDGRRYFLKFSRVPNEGEKILNGMSMFTVKTIEHIPYSMGQEVGDDMVVANVYLEKWVP